MNKKTLAEFKPTATVPTHTLPMTIIAQPAQQTNHPNLIHCIGTLTVTWRVTAPLLGSLFVFCLAFFSPINYFPTDSHFSLIVSQVLLEHGTLTLDPYIEQLADQIAHQPYQVGYWREHYYYAYPWGVSFLALPAVWLANLAGMNMVEVADNNRLQNLLSALCCAMLFWQLCILARRFIPARDSFFVSAILVSGSAWISTIATALWSINVAAIIFIGCLLTLSTSRADRSRGQPYWLGALLFVGFASRPTVLLLLPIVLVYEWRVWRKQPYAPFATLATFFALLLPYSMLYQFQLGLWLPDYYILYPRLMLKPNVIWQVGLATLAITVAIFLYLPSRRASHKLIWNRFAHTVSQIAKWLPQAIAWGVTGIVIIMAVVLAWWWVVKSWPEMREGYQWEEGLWITLYGSLLSPSRGLLVFSPFLFLTLAGVPLLWRTVRREPLFWLAIVWFWTQFTLVAVTNSWRGGHAFGPRVLADALPALALLTFILWRALLETRPHWRRSVAGAFLTLGALAIFINSGMALFNVHTVLWNQRPNVEYFPRKIFDWRCPQFFVLPSSNRICQLYYAQHGLNSGVGLSLQPNPFDRPLAPTNSIEMIEEAVFIGWWEAAPDIYWSESSKAHVLLRLTDVPDDPLTLTLAARGWGEQHVAMFINDVPVGTILFNVERAAQTIEIEPAAWRANSVNQITLSLPNARLPTLTEAHTLGLGYLQHQLGLTDAVLTLSSTE